MEEWCQENPKREEEQEEQNGKDMATNNNKNFHHMSYTEERLGDKNQDYCEIKNVIKSFCDQNNVSTKNMNSREDNMILENFKLYNPPGDGDCFFHCIVKFLQINNTKEETITTSGKLPTSGQELRFFMAKYIKYVATWCDENLMPKDVRKTLDILNNQKSIVESIFVDFKKTHRSFTEPQLIRTLIENDMLHFYPFITDLPLKEQLKNIAKNISDPKLYIGDEFAIFIMQNLFETMRITVLIPQVVKNAWIFQFGNYQNNEKSNTTTTDNENLDILLFLYQSHYYLFVPKNI